MSGRQIHKLNDRNSIEPKESYSVELLMSRQRCLGTMMSNEALHLLRASDFQLSRQEAGMIKSVSQAPWPWWPAWAEVGGIAPFVRCQSGRWALRPWRLSRAGGAAAAAQPAGSRGRAEPGGRAPNPAPVFRQLQEQGADFLLTLKGIQKTLHRQIRSQFQGKRNIPFVTATDHEFSHGRRHS